MERASGVEPPYLAWKASVLPLNYARMGRGGFEPPKRKRNRFTVCPLWPLGNLPGNTKNTEYIYKQLLQKSQRKNKKVINPCALYKTKHNLYSVFFIITSPGEESNLQPEVYKTPALPIELPGHNHRLH